MASSADDRDESLWDVNGVKLWTLCAEMLACSSSSNRKMHHTAAPTQPLPLRTDGKHMSIWSASAHVLALTEFRP